MSLPGAEDCTRKRDEVASLLTHFTGPHQDHTNATCYGGRDDCCTWCAIADSLCKAADEINAWLPEAECIPLPQWHLNAKAAAWRRATGKTE